MRALLLLQFLSHCLTALAADEFRQLQDESPSSSWFSGGISNLFREVWYTATSLLDCSEVSDGPKNPNCIYTEQELRDKINANDDAIITLCQVCDDSEVIELTSEIDITGKSFSIHCLANDNCIPSEDCMIHGTGGGHRLFSGAPTNAQFDSIGFNYGQANNEGGGVFHLTGGTTTLSKCRFNYNTAGGDGGALFVSGPSTQVTLTETRASIGNEASGYGGFLVATNGASVVLEDSGDAQSTWSWSDQSGGFVAARNGANVELRNMVVHCGNQAKNGGDYLFIEDDDDGATTVTCQDVDFDVLATSTIDEIPPWFNSTKGILGNSDSCKSSDQLGTQPQCKRQG